MRALLINVYVSDLDYAMKWYQESLGFKLSNDHYNYPVAIDLVHNSEIRLLLHKAEKPANIEISEDSATVITFQVDDIREKIKEFKRKGIEFLHDEPQFFPLGEWIAFKDPFGNILELAELKSGAQLG